MYRVDNAIIMAAGASSRFAPLSYECPKALLEVKGEVLIERQICQLKEAGIPEIYVVVGYKAEMFEYLREKFGVHIVENREYLTRNNHSSIYAVREVLGNSYICSADNYYCENPFEPQVEDSYYAALYSNGPTDEWCISTDEAGFITDVRIGGSDAWYMLGHAFWSEVFSRQFLEILAEIYETPETYNLFWENIFIDYIHRFRMRMRKYKNNKIFEFDSLDELREFDESYIKDTRSVVLKDIARQLKGKESEIINIRAYKGENATAVGMRFEFRGNCYEYAYSDQQLRRI